MHTNEKIKEIIKDCLEVKIEYLMHGKMPWDDPNSNTTRDVYRITLVYKSRTYSTLYGQSVMDSDFRKMHDTQIRDLLRGPSRDPRHWTKEYEHYLNRNSILRKRYGKKPSIADVLYSIERYDPYSFEDFCESFGYDNDSIKAHKTYTEVQAQYHFMMRMPCLDEINEILQDY